MGESVRTQARIIPKNGEFLLQNDYMKVVYRGIDPALVEQLVILFGLDEL